MAFATRVTAAACLLNLLFPVQVRSQGAAWFDLPLAGGTRTLAAFGIARADRAEALPLLARILYGQESRADASAARLAEVVRSDAGSSTNAAERVAAVEIPAPLTRDAWSGLLALAPGEDLSTRLLTDRAATLLAAGFVATDPSVRNLALRDRELLARLYREAPGKFVLSSRSLHVDGGRVRVPGGEGADAIWQRLAGEPPSRPSAFLIALLTKDSGRLAWYFDTLTTLDDTRLHLAWPPGSLAQRLDNARALYESFRDADIRWRLEDFPFRRAPGDASLLLRLADIHNGALAGPKPQWFWDALYARANITRDEAARVDRTNAAPVSLTWLARMISGADLRTRRDRFEQFRLIQRTFPDMRDEDAPALLAAFSGYAHYKAVLLTLEKLGIRDPAIWAELVEASQRVERADGDRRDAIVAFQSAFALIARMWQMRSTDTDGAEKWLRSLAAAVGTDRRVPRVIGEWIAATWCCETPILERLSGPKPRLERTVDWEGLTYQLDYSAAERDRLNALLRENPGPLLDAAIDSRNEKQIAAALLRLIYAVASGEPDGPITLSRDVAERHDFGRRAPTLSEDLWPWAPPIEQQGNGRPWHVQGSLIGLELGLARLAMRHLAGDQMPQAPTLTVNNYETFARTVLTMAPANLTDPDRDEVVAAIARGRARVAHAAGDLAALQALAREANLPAAQRELLPVDRASRTADRREFVFAARFAVARNAIAPC